MLSLRAVGRAFPHAASLVEVNSSPVKAEETRDDLGTLLALFQLFRALQTVALAKARYRDSMKELDRISQAIHKARSACSCQG